MTQGVKQALEDIERDHKWYGDDSHEQCVFCGLQKIIWIRKKKEINKFNQGHISESEEFTYGVISQYFCMRNGEYLVRNPKHYQ